MSDQENQLELNSPGGVIPVSSPVEPAPGDNQAPQSRSPGASYESTEGGAGAKTPDLSLDPQETVRRMVGVVQAGREQERSSEDIVASLLRLVEGKNKLVFIRFDLLEIYKIWTAKLAGKDRVS